MSEQTPTAAESQDVPESVDERAPVERGDGGPVDLSDRTAPGNPGTGYSGSPVGNQGKAEPMPPTPGHRDPDAPLTPPSLDEMTVGADDPQRPSLGAGLADRPAQAPSAGPRDLGGPGTNPADDRPAPDTTSSTGRATGPEQPVSVTPGESHRAPGLQGTTSPAEQVETDVESSAGHMVRDTGRPSGSGNPHGVDSVGETPSAGTSQEHGVVQGARIPRTDGAGQD
jgi:hypothetical protein